MKNENNKNNFSGLYQCKKCGFHYADKEWAGKCEAWCKKHHSCNLEITSRAEENISQQKTINQKNV